MTNRWHRAVKTTTFTVGDYQYESRRLGAPAIMTTVFEFEGMGDFIEELLDGIVDLQKIQAWVAKSNGKIEFNAAEQALTKKLLEHVLTRLQSMGLSPGSLLTTLMRRFPRLAAALLVQGAVLQEGETEDMVYDFIDSLSFSEAKDLLTQWYQFNLEELVGPLVAKAKAAAAAEAEAKCAVPNQTPPKPKAPGQRSAFGAPGR